MSDELRKPVEAAMDELRGSVRSLDELLDRIESGSRPTNVELFALAYMLETFYTWVENVLKNIARALNESLPDGPSWHAGLLRQMQCPAENRPAVIPDDLVPILSDLRTFRHRSRNLSLQVIAWELIQPIAVNARDTLEKFDKAITQFLDQMEAR